MCNFHNFIWIYINICIYLQMYVYIYKYTYILAQGFTGSNRVGISFSFRWKSFLFSSSPPLPFLPVWQLLRRSISLLLLLLFLLLLLNWSEDRGAGNWHVKSIWSSGICQNCLSSLLYTHTHPTPYKTHTHTHRQNLDGLFFWQREGGGGGGSTRGEKPKSYISCFSPHDFDVWSSSDILGFSSLSRDWFQPVGIPINFC